MKFLSEEALSSFASTARKQTFLHFDTDIFNLQNCEPVVLKHWTSRWTTLTIAYLNYQVDRGNELDFFKAHSSL